MRNMIIATLCLISGSIMAETPQAAEQKLPPLKFVKEMGAGWNLGNTFDSIGPDETAWGNPKVTKELIDAIAARGFKTIRIPVTWRMHMQKEPGFIIESDWMDRIENAVKYAFENDMYVILNTHHENEWTIPDYQHLDESTNRLGKVWSQIATRFGKYGDHLVFEPLNETRVEGSPQEWSGGSEENRDCINIFQKVCVDAIRASGGNNTGRMILIAPHGASNTPNAINALVVPNNDPNIIISIHNYFPVDFCLDKRADWGSPEDIESLHASFEALNQRFISKGLAVILGEWGSTNNGNMPARIKHAEYYMREAARYGMCPIWWDNGNRNEFGIINRRTQEWYFPEIADLVSTVPQ